MSDRRTEVSAGVSEEALRDRHAGTLDERLLPLEDGAFAHVSISVAESAARTRCGQVLAVGLANLLGRLEGVVQTLSVEVEGTSQQLLPNVDPRSADGGIDLREAIEAAARLVAHTRVAGQQSGTRRIRIRVGGAGEEPADVFVSAGAWAAYAGPTEGPPLDSDTALPFGALAAAALATGDVFRLVREQGATVPSVLFSTWELAPVDSLDAGPKDEEVLERLGAGIPPFLLVGAGAVGSAFLLGLWSCPFSVMSITAVDADAVSDTNLNRYPLFGADDVGESKVHRASELLGRADPSFYIEPAEEWWASYYARNPAPVDLLVSAVDKNRPRHEIQDALPNVILGGSTSALRSEVNRYELSDDRSPCLKCNNPPEPVEPDDDLHRRLLGMDDSELQKLARDQNVDVEALETYVNDLRIGGEGCAVLSGPALDRLRHADTEAAFAVSFVSWFAGITLCAQIVREVVSRQGGPRPGLAPPTSRAPFQFWRPEVPTNCPKQTSPVGGCWCGTETVRRVAKEARQSGEC